MNLGIGICGGVAQSVEHLPFKQVAGSSNLPTLTKFRKASGFRPVAFCFVQQRIFVWAKQEVSEDLGNDSYPSIGFTEFYEMRCWGLRSLPRSVLGKFKKKR
jgi:hypothetical protein